MKHITKTGWNIRDSIRRLALFFIAFTGQCFWLAPVSTLAGNTAVGDWSFLGSQNPGWTVSRTYTLTANGIQLGTTGVGEGMMQVAKPTALSFINSGVEMVFTGSNTVGNNQGYAYLSMFRDAGNPPRNAYGITASNFTATGTRLTTSVNNGTTGGEIITHSSMANANFVGRHTMALVRFDDNTLKAYLDGVEIGSRASTAPSLTLQYLGVGSNYFGGATYLPQGTVVERVRAFTFPSGGFSSNDLLIVPSANPANAGTSSVGAAPSTVTNNGIATSTITVILRDSGGTPVTARTVTLVSSRGATDTISASSGTSNASGIVTFTVKSSTAGTSLFTATDTTDGVTLIQTATVTFSATAVSGTTSTVAALPSSIVANGSTTSTISVTLKDASSNAVVGKTATLASSRGATDTISAASGPSNASGIVTFTVKSTSVGVAVFTATDTTDSLILSQTAAVTFTAGAVSASASTAAAAPTSVLADGTTTSTVTGTLKDAYGNPVAGKSVTLASSRGATDTLSAASGPSNASGIVTFTVRSATAGSSVYTATDATDGIVVTQTASVAYVDGTAKDILSCNFGTLGAATISGTSITLAVPPSQSRTALAPTFTLSPAATLSPTSGSTQNFTNPVIYTVTASNGSTKAYTVAVVLQAPDFTQPGAITGLDPALVYYTYNLGPSGMRGYIYHNWPITPRQDAYTALGPWQVLVTTVGANTPAAGVMAKDDVILGVSTGAGNTPVPFFSQDARKSFGLAITAAEAGDGVTNIKRWRAGITSDVSIQLPLTNLAYTNTAPYSCPKTAQLMTNAADNLQQYILQHGWSNGSSPGSISALALLATGDPKYLPMLQTYARSLAPPTLDLEQTGGISAWACYESIFLAEYYMLTNDAQVFHGLSEYVTYAATHQSMFGTAGHGFSNVPPPGGWIAGGTHGSMSWYGPVNSAGLVAQLSVVLGKKAGVVSPEIDPAIERAANFFGYYVNRGSIPYGEHQPYCGDYQLQGQSRTYYDHRSNGKDGLAAVLFGCMGNKPLQTEYYSRMAVAGYMGEQYGHTGQGFSYLWTTLGANVGGATAVAEYLKQVRWHRDLTRRSDGSFVYDGGEQFGCSHADDYWAQTTYYDNPTAYYVLHAAIPLKKLCITGKSAIPANDLSAPVVSNALWAADFTSQCSGYSTAQLVTALSEWDPIVRMNAATELGVRPDAQTLIPSLIIMAENPTDANQREAACTALGCMGATSAVPALVRRLSDPDIWVRAKAAKALGSLGTAPVSSVPAMMSTFVSNVAPTYPFQAGFNWDDPLQISNGYLAETLFSNLGTYSISADKSVLYPAVRAGIKHPAGMWRNQLSDFVQNRLTLDDIKALMPDILEDARTEGPCDRMFTPGPPQAAMNVLSKYHIQEGVEVCLDNVGYWGDLARTAIQRLTDYGEAARWTLPDLYADLGWWTHDNNYSYLGNTITGIEAATTSPSLIYGLPVGDPRVVATAVNAAKALTLTGSTCRTGTLTYAIATLPAHGSLTGTAPNVTYTPAANHQGMDSFTFTTTDSLTTSSPARVNVVVGTGGTGLTGLYYDNVDFTSLQAIMTNSTIDFDWGTAPPTGPMGANTYSVRWTGQVLAPETGIYRFSTRSSDGVRLWVNGVQVINDWNDQTTNIWNDSGPIALTAGQKYNVKMEYYRNVNPATVRLYWYIPSRQDKMIIPQEVLYPASGVSLTSPVDGARFGLPATVTLTADVTDLSGTITNVSFYNGATLIGSDTTAPYSFVWTNVSGGQYSVTARATTSTGAVSTSAAALITVDLNTVPVTAGLACYFDAAVGITTDGNGSVASWIDRSGNGHHATLGSGSPVLAANQINAKPAVQLRGNSSWLNTAGTYFVKEQYVVVRSPNTTWSGSGSFLGRSNTTGQFLAARPSSFNLYSGQTGFWDDWLASAVSKNGTAVSSGRGTMPRGGFQLGTITGFMILKVIVQDATPAVGNVTYQIGQNDTLGSCEMDIAEIIGYDSALSAANESKVGSYLAKKYGLTTTYPVTRYSTTALALTGGSTPSPVGAALTFTATVNGSTPTGNVSFYAGATLLGTSALNGSIQASVTTTSLAAGSHNVTAQYAGDANNDASPSTPLAMQVFVESIANWRPTYFTPVEITAGLAADGADPDGDGISNLDEYIRGTNPRTATLPELTITRSGNNCILSFTARSASGSGYAGLTRKYDLVVSPDIKTPASWTDVIGSTNVVGGGQTYNVTLPVAPPNKCYRLKVRLE